MISCSIFFHTIIQKSKLIISSKGVFTCKTKLKLAYDFDFDSFGLFGAALGSLMNEF